MKKQTKESKIIDLLKQGYTKEEVRDLGFNYAMVRKLHTLYKSDILLNVAGLILEKNDLDFILKHLGYTGYEATQYKYTTRKVLMVGNKSPKGTKLLKMAPREYKISLRYKTNEDKNRIDIEIQKANYSFSDEFKELITKEELLNEFE